MALIDKVFKRILELDGNPRNRGDYGGKAYIRHCMEDHNGQVPLWVLANDLSFGQTVWFFQVQSPAVRLAVAESFTGLYADTHDGPRRITIKRLDSIFNRLVTCARMTSAAIVPCTMGALTRTCTRPSVILAICLTRTITWNCSVASPHWSHGRPPPCHRGDKRSCLLWACANGNWPTGRKSYCAADRSCHWDGGVAGGFGL